MTDSNPKADIKRVDPTMNPSKANPKLSKEQQQVFIDANTPRRNDPEATSWHDTVYQILSSTWLVSVLSVVFAFIIGGILIIAANAEVHVAAEHFTENPGGFFAVCWDTFAKAYFSLFSGSVLNFNGADFAKMIEPLTSTLTRATPLIFAGLGLAVGFKASLFNIGGQGQIVMGALLSALIGFSFDLPAGLLLPMCVIGGFVGGAFWGFIPGILKAKTQANEVIVTIMLNYVALNFIRWALLNPVYQKEGQNVPIAKPMSENAIYPKVFGAAFTTNFSFIVALIAVAVVWWLVNRSYLGFEMRAVGLNPFAAQNAGIKVNSIYLWTMIISGGLCGLAATSSVLVPGTGVSQDVASTFGFDAITVALLGRSNPIGTCLAAILFGALKAGGYVMQAQTQTPIDVVQIIQALVVMFIAAPPLVRKIFHLPQPIGKDILEEVA